MSANTPELESGTPSDSQLQNLEALINRVRSLGQEIDDETVTALSEATGASPEYVRIAILRGTGTAAERKRTTIRDLYFSFDPILRKVVIASSVASIGGLAFVLRTIGRDPSGLWGFFLVASVALGLYTTGTSVTRKLAVISGATFGTALFFAAAVFKAILGFFISTGGPIEAFAFIFGPFAGAGIGAFLYEFVAKNSKKLGIAKSTDERQALLAQMLELQAQLKSHEQEISFLSLDMVGSTDMKLGVDPLTVEFVFTEYHNYVAQIVGRHGGRVHSTAGDGVTCAFDNPGNAFAAARQIQAGLFELNFHRNKLSKPIRLRAGIHHGHVNSMDGSIENINFSSVIDFAAHLQKACPIGGIAISTEAARLVPDPAAYSDEVITVDNLEARIFRPVSQVDPSNLLDTNPTETR
ncbi:MAG: hypothetical protein JNJ45_08290 [Chthonomonas sp.]|nr:hypothetical protein [Chthonomonas sp.]